MKKLYYNIEKRSKSFSDFFWLLSTISWVLLIVTSFYSIVNIYNERGGILFTIVKYRLFDWVAKKNIYIAGVIYPLQMHPIFFYVIIALVSSTIFLSFSIYLIIVLYKKGISKYDEMLPSINKFVFIPFFSMSILFIIGECYYFNTSRWERRNIIGFFFNIIGFLSILYIYINYNLKIISDIKYIYIIKKGCYSCLIFLHWYYFCYIITNILILYLSDDYYFNIIKICGVILPLLFGSGGLIFSFFFKDIVFAFLSFLINLGCVFYFFSIDEIYRKQYNAFFDGIIYILNSLLFLSEIILLYIKYRKILLY